MKKTVASEAIHQLFTEARTYTAWLPDEISDDTLREVYDLMKWGPTSANCCPARIVFVRKGPKKELLISCLDPGNVPKVKAAPVTAIIAMDQKFYDFLPKLFPPAPGYRDVFASNRNLSESTAFRNGSLQGAYFIMAARSLGLDCGPMSGFNNGKLDELFFSGTSWRSNFLCNIGHGDPAKLNPRSPRFRFEEACRIESD